MSTLVYSPGIEVMIDTLGKGIIDVSEDISNGTLTLTENQSASFSFNIINHRRKYDGLFTPNDIVVVKLKRMNWLPVFAGYLDEVPYFSVYPKTVHLTASDTLKRLKMKVWDKGSGAAYELLSSVSGPANTQVDGGLRDKIIAILTEVADWPLEKIHIGHIPSDWSEKLEPLRIKLAQQVYIDPADLGESGVVNGTNLLARGLTTIPGGGAGTGILPAERGRAGTLTKTGNFSLSGEGAARGRAGSHSGGPSDQWYMAMRWPYQTDNQESETPQGEYLSPSEASAARRWWKNRKILVVNPMNNKGVVLRAVEWGPAKSTGYVAQLSPFALKEGLGADPGKQLEYRFAPDDMTVGRIVETDAPPERKGRGGYEPGRTQTPEAQSPVVVGESGGAWKGGEDLQPHTLAARNFVKANWNTGRGIGGYVNRNIGGTSKKSDHATGHAIDVSVAAMGAKAAGAELAMGNAIAMWFVANPLVFGVRYVIFMDRINSGSGWKRYQHPTGSSGNTVQHRDHVHISFEHQVQTEAGPMGSSWPGGTPADFNNYVATDNGASWSAGGPSGGGPGGYDIYSGLVGPDGLPLLNAFNWQPQPDPFSDMLWGPRALMNDTPILSSVSELVQASMRSFMAAPNGDFIAWFPDYFGIYGTASKIVVKDIEIIGEGFTIAWTDSHLITHQYTAGSTTGFATSSPGEPVTIENQINTMGIATVEFPELMEALFNVGPGGGRGTFFSDPEAIFQRFGARVNYQPMETITGEKAEFWYAVRLFMQAWASQFSSQVHLSFMPEIWPGMLVQLESFQFQAYVEEVSHSFDFADGGGFKTDIRIVAPSTSDRDSRGFYALPLSGDAPPPRPPAIVTGPNQDPRSKYAL